MDMLGCRYMDRSCIDNKRASSNTRQWWTEEYTRYGLCRIFNPDRDLSVAEKV